VAALTRRPESVVEILSLPSEWDCAAPRTRELLAGCFLRDIWSACQKKESVALLACMLDGVDDERKRAEERFRKARGSAWWSPQARMDEHTGGVLAALIRDAKVSVVADLSRSNVATREEAAGKNKESPPRELEDEKGELEGLEKNFQSVLMAPEVTELCIASGSLNPDLKSRVDAFCSSRKEVDLRMLAEVALKSASKAYVEELAAECARSPGEPACSLKARARNLAGLGSIEKPVENSDSGRSPESDRVLEVGCGLILKSAGPLNTCKAHPAVNFIVSRVPGLGRIAADRPTPPVLTDSPLCDAGGRPNESLAESLGVSRFCKATGDKQRDAELDAVLIALSLSWQEKLFGKAAGTGTAGPRDERELFEQLERFVLEAAFATLVAPFHDLSQARGLVGTTTVIGGDAGSWLGALRKLTPEEQATLDQALSDAKSLRILKGSCLGPSERIRSLEEIVAQGPKSADFEQRWQSATQQARSVCLKGTADLFQALEQTIRTGGDLGPALQRVRDACVGEPRVASPEVILGVVAREVLGGSCDAVEDFGPKLGELHAVLLPRVHAISSLLGGVCLRDGSLRYVWQALPSIDADGWPDGIGLDVLGRNGGGGAPAGSSCELEGSRGTEEWVSLASGIQLRREAVTTLVAGLKAIRLDGTAGNDSVEGQVRSKVEALLRAQGAGLVAPAHDAIRSALGLPCGMDELSFDDGGLSGSVCGLPDWKWSKNLDLGAAQDELARSVGDLVRRRLEGPNVRETVVSGLRTQWKGGLGEEIIRRLGNSSLRVISWQMFPAVRSEAGPILKAELSIPVSLPGWPSPVVSVRTSARPVGNGLEVDAPLLPRDLKAWLQAGLPHGLRFACEGEVCQLLLRMEGGREISLGSHNAVDLLGRETTLGAPPTIPLGLLTLKVVRATLNVPGRALTLDASIAWRDGIGTEVMVRADPWSAADVAWSLDEGAARTVLTRGPGMTDADVSDVAGLTLRAAQVLVRTSRGEEPIESWVENKLGQLASRRVAALGSMVCDSADNREIPAGDGTVRIACGSDGREVDLTFLMGSCDLRFRASSAGSRLPSQASIDNCTGTTNFSTWTGNLCADGRTCTCRPGNWDSALRRWSLACHVGINGTTLANLEAAFGVDGIVHKGAKLTDGDLERAIETLARYVPGFSPINCTSSGEHFTCSLEAGGVRLTGVEFPLRRGLRPDFTRAKLEAGAGQSLESGIGDVVKWKIQSFEVQQTPSMSVRVKFLLSSPAVDQSLEQRITEACDVPISNGGDLRGGLVDCMEKYFRKVMMAVVVPEVSIDNLRVRLESVTPTRPMGVDLNVLAGFQSANGQTVSIRCTLPLRIGERPSAPVCPELELKELAHKALEGVLGSLLSFGDGSPVGGGITNIKFRNDELVFDAALQLMGTKGASIQLRSVRLNRSRRVRLPAEITVIFSEEVQIPIGPLNLSQIEATIRLPGAGALGVTLRGSLTLLEQDLRHVLKGRVALDWTSQDMCKFTGKGTLVLLDFIPIGTQSQRYDLGTGTMATDIALGGVFRSVIDLQGTMTITLPVWPPQSWTGSACKGSGGRSPGATAEGDLRILRRPAANGTVDVDFLSRSLTAKAVVSIPLNQIEGSLHTGKNFGSPVFDAEYKLKDIRAGGRKVEAGLSISAAPRFASIEVKTGILPTMGITVPSLSDLTLDRILALFAGLDPTKKSWGALPKVLMSCLRKPCSVNPFSDFGLGKGSGMRGSRGGKQGGGGDGGGGADDGSGPDTGGGNPGNREGASGVAGDGVGQFSDPEFADRSGQHPGSGTAGRTGDLLSSRVSGPPVPTTPRQETPTLNPSGSYSLRLVCIEGNDVRVSARSAEMEIPFGIIPRVVADGSGDRPVVNCANGIGSMVDAPVLWAETFLVTRVKGGGRDVRWYVIPYLSKSGRTPRVIAIPPLDATTPERKILVTDFLGLAATVASSVAESRTVHEVVVTDLQADGAIGIRSAVDPYYRFAVRRNSQAQSVVIEGFDWLYNHKPSLVGPFFDAMAMRKAFFGSPYGVPATGAAGEEVWARVVTSSRILWLSAAEGTFKDRSSIYNPHTDVEVRNAKRSIGGSAMSRQSTSLLALEPQRRWVPRDGDLACLERDTNICWKRTPPGASPRRERFEKAPGSPGQLVLNRHVHVLSDIRSGSTVIAEQAGGDEIVVSWISSAAGQAGVEQSFRADRVQLDDLLRDGNLRGALMEDPTPVVAPAAQGTVRRIDDKYFCISASDQALVVMPSRVLRVMGWNRACEPEATRALLAMAWVQSGVLLLQANTTMLWLPFPTSAVDGGVPGSMREARPTTEECGEALVPPRASPVGVCLAPGFRNTIVGGDGELTRLLGKAVDTIGRDSSVPFTVTLLSKGAILEADKRSFISSGGRQAVPLDLSPVDGNALREAVRDYHCLGDNLEEGLETVTKLKLWLRRVLMLSEWRSTGDVTNREVRCSSPQGGIEPVGRHPLKMALARYRTSPQVAESSRAAPDQRPAKNCPGDFPDPSVFPSGYAYVDRPHAFDDCEWTLSARNEAYFALALASQGGGGAATSVLFFKKGKSSQERPDFALEFTGLSGSQDKRIRRALVEGTIKELESSPPSRGPGWARATKVADGVFVVIRKAPTQKSATLYSIRANEEGSAVSVPTGSQGVLAQLLNLAPFSRSDVTGATTVECADGEASLWVPRTAAERDGHVGSGDLLHDTGSSRVYLQSKTEPLGASELPASLCNVPKRPSSGASGNAVLWIDGVASGAAATWLGEVGEWQVTEWRPHFPSAIAFAVKASGPVTNTAWARPVLALLAARGRVRATSAPVTPVFWKKDAVVVASERGAGANSTWLLLDAVRIATSTRLDVIDAAPSLDGERGWERILQRTVKMEVAPAQAVLWGEPDRAGKVLLTESTPAGAMQVFLSPASPGGGHLLHVGEVRALLWRESAEWIRTLARAIADRGESWRIDHDETIEGGGFLGVCRHEAPALASGAAGARGCPGEMEGDFWIARRGGSTRSHVQLEARGIGSWQSNPAAIGLRGLLPHLAGTPGKYLLRGLDGTPSQFLLAAEVTDQQGCLGARRLWQLDGGTSSMRASLRDNGWPVGEASGPSFSKLFGWLRGGGASRGSGWCGEMLGGLSVVWRPVPNLPADLQVVAFGPTAQPEVRFAGFAGFAAITSVDAAWRDLWSQLPTPPPRGITFRKTDDSRDLLGFATVPGDHNFHSLLALYRRTGGTDWCEVGSTSVQTAALVSALKAFTSCPGRAIETQVGNVPRRECAQVWLMFPTGPDVSLVGPVEGCSQQEMLHLRGGQMADKARRPESAMGLIKGLLNTYPRDREIVVDLVPLSASGTRKLYSAKAANGQTSEWWHCGGGRTPCEWSRARLYGNFGGHGVDKNMEGQMNLAAWGSGCNDIPSLRVVGNSAFLWSCNKPRAKPSGMRAVVGLSNDGKIACNLQSDFKASKEFPVPYAIDRKRSLPLNYFTEVVARAACAGRNDGPERLNWATQEKLCTPSLTATVPCEGTMR
jgi:hypothetical protein